MTIRRVLWLVMGLAAAARSQSVYRPAPVAPRDFAVMAWGGSPSDPEQLRLMREAGLNISGFCRVEDLDRVRDAGLTCFIRDQRANGYDWSNLPEETGIRANVAELKGQVGAHAAALGFYLRDEPHGSLMPGLGRVAAVLREAMPELWPYVNLFPYRVTPDRLGTADYDTYVRLLVDSIRQPFLSYDNYSLVNGEMLDYFFTNLEIVRRLGLETKTPFWNCILANAHFNYMEPSDATFHLQVYSTLAYGGRGIQYFTYFTPQIGNYRLGAVDQFGNRTPTWDMLRRINNEIHALAPTLIHLRSTGVFHSPDVPDQARPLAESRLVKGVEMTQRLVRSPAMARFLVGEFEDAQQRPYVMLVNKELAQSFRFSIQLKQEGRKLLRISPYSGREEPFGREMDWLAPGAGVLFRIE
ncbi:MAG: hypothetical protein HY238_19970 [Acidobacteria bacterium]|nr:hypothetical protein [Acidobacteriota bacterium]